MIDASSQEPLRPGGEERVPTPGGAEPGTPPASQPPPDTSGPPAVEGTAGFPWSLTKPGAEKQVV